MGKPIGARLFIQLPEGIESDDSVFPPAQLIEPLALFGQDVAGRAAFVAEADDREARGGRLQRRVVPDMALANTVRCAIRNIARSSANPASEATWDARICRRCVASSSTSVALSREVATLPDGARVRRPLPPDEWRAR
jgi:hypothetical protein